MWISGHPGGVLFAFGTWGKQALMTRS